ncbi:hypothetical protein VOLCADRAFT_103147 [Volvox carteri f. nagariensis]|uniref:Phospholipid/glycerol acyltransferase domain-containing protein n=1 Tax=Volvox carteri f. nagariensis TaxID=3068 RepID=D8TJU6_VOLCA|nr:uncharacterized protein VOLCADRAFT_103147 [Volvox carteri f. nagariensis]EFJ51950.1 hypothetical protein VOLCADRAFT_103147 [Volvox carteri f. nagariensis]|eukprot:XP_002946724.1 hypothetical protein VOLCADRAFT_103147 [Volvox carteri f. nagariensis]
MPPYSNLQLLKLHYREFLRKTAAYHRGDGGDACAHTYYVERAWSEASFEDSLTKLSQVLSTVDIAELRASYHARKERAKERLRRAFDAKLSRLGNFLNSVDESSSSNSKEAFLSSPRGVLPQLPTEESVASVERRDLVASTSGTSSDLQQLYGTNGFLRRTVLYLLGNAARTYMTNLNATRVEGMESMAAALQRPAGQALITVSNHVAALDDPLVVSALLPEGALERPESIRWTLCATDRCFRYRALVPLFRAAKVLPVVRGGGMAQPGMAAAEARLAAGEWVHIFPEGTRSPDGVTLGSVRKGVGRLVASVPADAPPPLVVPFVHRGMEDVMPRGAVLPAVGQQIDVLVGAPIPVADILSAARAEGWSADRLHTAVAARVAHGLKDLRRRLDARRAGLPDPGPSPPEPLSTCSVSILDQFDHSDLALAARLRDERRRGSRGGGVSATWERLKSRMALQHRTWATQGVAAAAVAPTATLAPAANGPVPGTCCSTRAGDSVGGTAAGGGGRSGGLWTGAGGRKAADGFDALHIA